MNGERIGVFTVLVTLCRAAGDHDEPGAASTDCNERRNEWY